MFQDVHLKPQLQLSAGQHSTLTTATNNINSNENNSSATSIDIRSSATASNMESAAEIIQTNSAAKSTLSESNHNGNGIVDVNLESEERDEFVDIKVGLYIVTFMLISYLKCLPYPYETPAAKTIYYNYSSGDESTQSR